MHRKGNKRSFWKGGGDGCDFSQWTVRALDDHRKRIDWRLADEITQQILATVFTGACKQMTFNWCTARRRALDDDNNSIQSWRLIRRLMKLPVGNGKVCKKEKKANGNTRRSRDTEKGKM